jgi:beta-lactamase regulating signal transducer with metallopeptidase domain
MKSFALLVAAAGPAALVSTLGRVPVDAAWVERLGWTLIHTIWQFALVALVAAVLQRGLRRHSARARYAAGVVLLGAMAVAPGITCCVVDVTRPSEVKHARLAPTRTPDETPSRSALPFPRSPMDESDASESSVQTTTPSRHAADPLAAVGTHAAPREHPSLSWVATFRSKLAPRLPLLVSLWLAGMALFSLRPVWGLWMQWRLRRVGLSPVPASVAQCLDDLARRLGLRRTVGIAQSVRVGAPMAVGYLRPLILLPGCVLTGLSAAQLEALLAHELAHIRRHDWLVNAFQLLVETVFFYHPAVWWLSRQIRQERENCCDDLAVLLVGDRGTVGRMLLALEELREQTPALSLAATGGNLLGRVRRVVAKGRQPEPPGREWLPAAVLLLLAGLGGAAWAMSAGTADTKNPPPAAPTTAAPVATAKSSDRSESKRDAKNHVSPIAKTLDVRRITGRVVDSQGQPVKAARLWWVVLDDPVNEQFIVKGTSDAQGRFSFVFFF